MNCEPETVEVGGSTIRRCQRCQRPMSEKYPNAKRNCGIVAEAARPKLPSALQSAAEAKADAQGMLLGDLIAAMTTAIGIPPCGGCEKRKAWLNKAHAWLLGR